MFRRGGPPKPGAASVPIDDEAAIDARLIRAAQKGDLASFNALVVRHERVVYALCLRMLRQPAAAEDAAQDTFLRAWSAVKQWDDGLVRPWLLRIASNRCLDLLRADARRPIASLDAQLVDTEPAWTSQSRTEDPEHFTARNELGRALERALNRLPDDQRLATLLFDVHALAYDEVAAVLGVPVGTVKSRISRGRARLRETLRDDPAARELLERFGRLNDE